MNRTALGIVALGLLAIGFYTVWGGPEGATGFAAGCIRVGLVLGALWLAYPPLARFLRRTPRWLLTASGIAVVVCAVKPLLLVVAIPLLGLLWFLGPKLSTKADKPLVPQKRPRRRSNAR
jgi:hypothetical protein